MMRITTSLALYLFAFPVTLIIGFGLYCLDKDSKILMFTIGLAALIVNKAINIDKQALEKKKETCLNLIAAIAKYREVIIQFFIFKLKVDEYNKQRTETSSEMVACLDQFYCIASDKSCKKLETQIKKIVILTIEGENKRKIEDDANPDAKNGVITADYCESFLLTIHDIRMNIIEIISHELPSQETKKELRKQLRQNNEAYIELIKEYENTEK